MNIDDIRLTPEERKIAWLHGEDFANKATDKVIKKMIELIESWESARKDVAFITVIIDKQDWQDLKKLAEKPIQINLRDSPR